MLQAACSSIRCQTDDFSTELMTKSDTSRVTAMWSLESSICQIAVAHKLRSTDWMLQGTLRMKV